MAYWMESPCDWHLEIACCSRTKSKCLSIAILHAVIGSPPQASWLAPLTHAVPSCWETPGPAGFGAATPLLMGLLGLGCSCLHLAYSAEASPCLQASLNPSLLSSCAWKAVLLSVNTCSTLSFLSIHCIVSAWALVGNRCLVEGDNCKDFQRCGQS